jgi:hypothetical protein
VSLRDLFMEITAMKEETVFALLMNRPVRNRMPCGVWGPVRGCPVSHYAPALRASVFGPFSAHVTMRRKALHSPSDALVLRMFLTS